MALDGFRSFDRCTAYADLLGLDGGGLFLALCFAVALFRFTEFPLNLRGDPASHFPALVPRLFCNLVLRCLGPLAIRFRLPLGLHPLKRCRLFDQPTNNDCFPVLGAVDVNINRSNGGRQLLILRFSRHCPVFAAFQGVYGQLVPVR